MPELPALAELIDAVVARPVVVELVDTELDAVCPPLAPVAAADVELEPWTPVELVAFGAKHRCWLQTSPLGQSELA